MERQRKEMLGRPDADGFVTVMAGIKSKGAGKTARAGMAGPDAWGYVSENRRAKNRRGATEAKDFYSFQKREKQINGETLAASRSGAALGPAWVWTGCDWWPSADGVGRERATAAQRRCPTLAPPFPLRPISRAPAQSWRNCARSSTRTRSACKRCASRACSGQFERARAARRGAPLPPFLRSRVCVAWRGTSVWLFALQGRQRDHRHCPVLPGARALKPHAGQAWALPPFASNLGQQAKRLEHARPRVRGGPWPQRRPSGTATGGRGCPSSP